jgi:predicted amidohydrolase
MVAMRFNVGLAQIAPRLGDVAGNLQRHLATAAEAAAQGVDLLIFPELSLTGYALGERAFDVAIRADGSDPVFAALLAASRDLDMVVSFVEEDARGRIFIAAAYLSGGQLAHRHRKIYLPTYGLFDEARIYAHGDTARAFDTRFGRVGLLICEDFWHVSLPYLLWQDGADVLILISASVEHGLGATTSTADRVLAINRAYALLFTDFVIHVNRAGEEAVGCYWGGSTVYGPDAALRVEGPRDEPALVVATLDTGDLRQARRDLPLLRDERADLTARELSRIVKRNEFNTD